MNLSPSESTSGGAAAAFRPVIILPTYNNASTLPDIVHRCEALGHPIIIVNDGSIDATAAWLKNESMRLSANRIHVVTHERNRGKAAALQTGFDEACRLGFTHAVTMDTDGQLDPEEIPRLLKAAQESPRSFIVGFRDDTRADYPGRSRLGRRLSNLAIRAECGASVRDSQCGLRVYPLQLHRDVHCQAGRFGFEAEIITRAAWAGYDIVNVPVTCRYFEGEKRVTHFKPWRDSMHGVKLHARLLLTRLLGRHRQHT